MSASNKKKLRKEQNTAAMTEKQLKELNEAKKLKNYTITFIVSMALVVAIVIGVLLRVPIATVVNRNTHAITVGNHEINAVELNYFYADAVSEYYSGLTKTYGEQAYLYAQLFYNVNFTRPLDDQIHNSDTGETWGEYFLNIAKENARTVYTLYDEAMEKGYKVSAEEQEDIDITIESMKLAADYAGFSSATAYARSLYGPGATPETFAKYYEMNTIASSYYASVVAEIGDGLKDSDYREHEKDKFNHFSSYTYYTYTVGMGDYITGGTKDDKGNITYTEEEKNTARAEAKKVAELLSGTKYETIEEFNKAIAALPVNKDNATATSDESKFVLYTSISDTNIQKWVSDPERKANDITMIPAEATTTDADGKETTVVNGYYVVVFSESRDNKMPLANVRHLLVKFEGGTTDSNGKVTYTDAEKAAAKKEAEELLAQWESGEKTEESFSKLVKEKTDDSGTKENGGLIEDITPDTGLVENFLNWCFDNRKANDCGIIESEYGYHIMFYCGDDELTYRDQMIKMELVNEAANEWLDERVEKITITDVDLSRVYYDYTAA